MIVVNERVILDDNELKMEFIRSSGPGGQNVNKVSTAVQLRFDVAGSPSLPEDVRRRLMRVAGSRLTKDGVLVLEARAERTQERNRQAAVERLVDLIRRACIRPKRRRKTRPTLASKERRIKGKKQRGQMKQMRKRPQGLE